MRKPRLIDGSPFRMHQAASRYLCCLAFSRSEPCSSQLAPVSTARIISVPTSFGPKHPTHWADYIMGHLYVSMRGHQRQLQYMDIAN